MNPMEEILHDNARKKASNSQTPRVKFVSLTDYHKALEQKILNLQLGGDGEFAQNEIYQYFSSARGVGMARKAIQTFAKFELLTDDTAEAMPRTRLTVLESPQSDITHSYDGWLLHNEWIADANDRPTFHHGLFLAYAHQGFFVPIVEPTSVYAETSLFEVMGNI